MRMILLCQNGKLMRIHNLIVQYKIPDDSKWQLRYNGDGILNIVYIFIAFGDGKITRQNM